MNKSLLYWWLVLAIVLGIGVWIDSKAQVPPNDAMLQINDALYLAEHKPPPPLTPTEELLREAVKLIELGRKACDPAYPAAQRAVWARQYMELTNPVRPDVILGGDSGEPNAQSVE